MLTVGRPDAGGGEKDPDRRTLADVTEDALLAAIFPFFQSGPADLVGPGDDAAVVAAPSGSVVATTDAMVRGRDWLDEWSTPEDVAAKCLTQNLADVAAMGGVPTSVLVTLIAEPQTRLAWVLAFARTLGEEAARYGVSVAGGDLSSAPTHTLTVSVTALGDLEHREPVLRSGARAGDVVAVAGSLGRSAAGLRLLQDDQTTGLGHHAAGRVELVLAAHRRPVAPLEQGPAAARAGATSMLDLSDGLLRDGSRIAKASGARLDFSSGLLAHDVQWLEPVVPAEVALECVLAGGEEHSLLATFPDIADVPEGWRQVGRVEPGSGVSVDGRAVTPRGWDHFAG